MSNPTELPDLDKLEAKMTLAIDDSRHMITVNPGDIFRLIDFARRAQPEGEAPQADVKGWRERMKNEPGEPMENHMIAEIKELRTLLASAPGTPEAPRKMSWTDAPYKTDYYASQAWAAGWNDCRAAQLEGGQGEGKAHA